MKILRWNSDKPHRCPQCHAVTVPYHDAERGCTMPLDTDGLPLTNSRTVIPAGPCRCKESDSHKMARLEQARKDTYDKYIEAVRAMSVFMAEISARES